MVEVQLAEQLFAMVQLAAKNHRSGNREQEVIRALIGYARAFRDSPLLSSVLVEGQRQFTDRFGRRLNEHDVDAQDVVDYAKELSELSRGLSLADACRDTIIEIVSEVESHPYTSSASLGEAFETALSVASGHDSAQIRRLQGKYRRSIARMRARQLASQLDCADPFVGAFLIGDLGRIQHGLVHPRADPNAWSAGQFVAAKLNKIQDNTGKPVWPHSIEDMAHAVQHVHAFHAWTIAYLSGRMSLEWNVRRFAQRSERYAFDELQNLTKMEGSTRDEAALVRRLCSYLHDQGFEPFSEYLLGQSRADVACGTSESTTFDVVVEVKVVRENDTRDAVLRRLSKGVGQAARYASRLRLGVGVLLVFWANNEAEGSLPSQVKLGDVDVLIERVDLRRSPSAGPAPRAWTFSADEFQPREDAESAPT